VEPSECVHLAKHVKQDCPNLLFSGLMTISMCDYTSTPENFEVISSSGIQDLRIWRRLLQLTGFGLHRVERCKSFGVCCEEHTLRVLCGLQQLMKVYI
jgi:hypothetical protein